MTSRQHDLPVEVEEAIALQKRAHGIVMAALSDAEFMSGVLAARRRQEAGDTGELLADVIKRLKLV